MKNQVQGGETFYAVAPDGGVLSGDLVYVGSYFGVAGYDAVAGQIMVLHNDGQIFSLPKIETEDWTAGMPVYWDSINKKASLEGDDGETPVVVTFGKIGVATPLSPDFTATGVADDTLGDVRLNPSF